MNYKSTLLLLIAVVVAALVAHSLSRKPSSQEVAAQRKRLLPDFRAADVKLLTIEGPNGRLVCRREGADKWRIIEPVNVRADRWEVQDILDKLETAEKVSWELAPGDPALYGLEHPVRTVTASRSGPAASAWTLRIGKEAGVAGTVWVAIEGREGVFAVSKDVVDTTDATLARLRSKELAPRISVFDLEALDVSAAPLGQESGFDLECAKVDDTWEIKAPLHDLADRRKVEAVANKLYGCRIGADDFMTDDPTKAADYGLDSPLLTVSLKGKGQEQTVTFSRAGTGEDARFYAMTRGEPAIVRVPKSLFDSLRRPPAELRARSLADFRVNDVAEMAVSGPAGEFVIRKQGDAWQIAGEPPVPADREIVESVLKELKKAEVKRFVADAPEDLAPYGLAEGDARRVTLRDQDGAELAAVELGGADAEAGARYVRRSGYPPVLSVPPAGLLAGVDRGRVAFLDRLLLEEPPAEATRVVLEHGGETFRCDWEYERVAWNLVEPVAGEADGLAVQAIVSDFARLRAAAFAAEKAGDLAAFGLAKPTARAQVTYADAKGNTRVRTLLLGAPADEPAEGAFARLDGDERVFVLPENVAAHYRANLASKQVCRAPDLTGLEFRMADRILKFAYDADKAFWTDAEGGVLDEPTRTAVATAAALLRDFRGTKVADYVPRDAAAYGFDKPLLVVGLKQEATEGKRVIIGSPAGAGGRYAKGSATSFVLVVADEDVARLVAVFGPAAGKPEAPAPAR